MEDVSVVELGLRLAFSLGVVLVLMVVAARVLGRTKGIGGAMRRRPAHVLVVARQPLGKNASVAIVQTGGRELVLGVTDSSVTLLTDREAPDEPEADHQEDLTTPGTAIVSGGGYAAMPAWKTIVDTLRDRTVRRS